MHARIVTWNLQWASPTSRRGRELRRRILAEAPDLACLTEATGDLMGEPGHAISSAADYGYDAPAGRRKVVLWSKQPWRAVDAVGHPALPSGRFVRATTTTPAGEVDVWGVCIPWRDAHVRTGRRDRRPWEDHLAYLRGLRELLAGVARRPRIVLGDYNQRIPRSRTPQRVFSELEGTFASLTIATAGPRPESARLAIDHIAHTPDLRTVEVRELSEHAEDDGGRRLSDHFGLLVVARGCPSCFP